jgi:oligopeptide transport system ATP-binding protein
MPLLEVQDLRTHLSVGGKMLRAVDGVTFNVNWGETIGLVGESGSGKSVTALSLLQLLPRATPHVTAGSAMFEDVDLVTASAKRMRSIRGRKIGMIFQDPTTSLNPMLTIGVQVTEGIRWHLRVSPREADERAEDLLHQVGMADPRRVLRAYPHELSGGMRQRVMIAIALSCEPSLLLADEPTTALDVTIQAQILDLLRSIADERGLAMILITHNLGIVSGYTHRTYVMYAGEIVEEALTRDLFSKPRHPYTMGLLESVPRLDRPKAGPLKPIKGSPPSPLERGAGCAFAPRCPFANLQSWEAPPSLESVGPEHLVACWVKP